MTRRCEVHKFGGTSVGDADRMRAVVAIIADASLDAAPVVVASAMSGTTDALEAACDAAASGERDSVVSALECVERAHRDAARALGIDLPDLDGTMTTLRDLLVAMAAIGEVTPRIRARVVTTGEKLSVQLLAGALRAAGVEADAVFADAFLETDATALGGAPVHGVTDRRIAAALSPMLAAGHVPVVTGFCGRAPDGSTTTLGRGGSDFTATLVGAALAADAVILWTDVDGVFTADPRVAPSAQVIPQLNFREAGELSYYGAKVLHQRTMIPVASAGIPVHIRNSMAPDRAGTVVDGGFTPGSHPVKAISAIRGQALVSVEGQGMAGVPGVAERMFGALAHEAISVTMISQSSSESSICAAVGEGDTDRAEIALRREFRTDISHGDVEEIVVERDVGIVAAIGLGMAHTPGVAARVFGTLSRAGVNVRAIAQGSSELNISLAVEQPDVDDAVRAIHDEFGLHRIDTGRDARGDLDLILVGCGNVGRAVVRNLLERHERLFGRFGLRPHIVGVVDSSGYRFDPAGLGRADLEDILSLKEGGGSLAGADGGTSCGAATEALAAMARFRLANPVLIDVTASGESGELFQAALDAGIDIVTANKIPLAGPYAGWRGLCDAASGARRLLRAEATVGAGLPVIDTLEMLRETGDVLVDVQGCLSGTLAFVMESLEAGKRFAEVVAEAVAAGYTEPDPVADLVGDDVARKAIIVSRVGGMAEGDLDVALEGLVDRSLLGLPADRLMPELERYDAPLAARVAAARERGDVVRYVARVTRDGIRVGPTDVPADSPLGSLRGPDNMIVVTSERYDARPLVVSGPGAGIDVTAMGVLSDVFRIAAERGGVR